MQHNYSEQIRQKNKSSFRSQAISEDKIKKDKGNKDPTNDKNFA